MLSHTPSAHSFANPMTMRSLTVHLLLVALVPLLASTAIAQVRVSKLIGDGMVMQRDIEVPVWGWAEAGETVEVIFDGHTYTAKPDDAGKWRITLPAMEAGGPYEMTIRGKSDRYDIKDILVGDVWIGSGQSNMEWTVLFSNDAEAEIAAANDPEIRHFKVPRSSAEKPEDELAGGEWHPTDPDHVANFTAVGYYFARELRKHVDVPIGLINTSWGGSRVEPWMSAEVLGMDNVESALAEIKRRNEAEQQRRLEYLRNRLGELPTEDAGLVDGQAIWADPELNDTDWLPIEVPVLWEQAGFEGLDGIAWYRTAITLTAEEAANGIQLGLGKIDDSDITWVNGQEVGRMEQAYNAARVYEVPASVLKTGENVIAVRVDDTGGGGGIWGEPELLFWSANGETHSLAGTWKFKVGAFRFNPNVNVNQVATLLYNKMIHPILDYPIKGAIWYQGESNAGPEDAYEYRTLFADMIQDWRVRWNVGDFPFLYVQLANFMAPDDQPKESSWAVLRESQSATLAVPNTAQAVIIDIGEADDIHPRNKQDVGLRLSLAARKLAYGEDLVYSGPTYRQHRIEGHAVVIEFDHVGSGLVTGDKYGYVRGFAIAGADQKYVWAKAAIKDNTVLVWSDEVPEPVSVRYAWSNNPDDANLYNVEGLPASPFRTDAPQ